MAAAIGRATESNPQLAHMMTPFLPDWVSQPEDIADAVCWLASEESRLVTATRRARPSI
jgi:NAD(P)-dependent dehydrogenase (short-subunit alcohol dehydrogenase family)